MAVWADPWRKPCYLFALVAGNLASVKDTFTTCSAGPQLRSFPRGVKWRSPTLQ